MQSLPMQKRALRHEDFFQPLKVILPYRPVSGHVIYRYTFNYNIIHRSIDKRLI
jgi:hypothetical protein